MWPRKCIFKIIRPTLCYYFTTLKFSYYHKKFVLKLRKISQKHHLAAEFKLWQPFSENQWPCKGSQSLVWGTLHLPDLSLADKESERKFGWSLNLEDGAAALDGVPQTTPMTTAVERKDSGGIPTASHFRQPRWQKACCVVEAGLRWLRHQSRPEKIKNKKYFGFLNCCCHHSILAIIILLTLPSTAT